MYNAFYEESEHLRKELEEYGEEDELEDFENFAFLENINNSFNQDELSIINLEKYLHGYCDEFAILLNRKYNYPIIAKFKDKNLIHAYCKKDNYYIDVRGITDESDLFFKEFEFDLLSEKFEKTFNNYKEFYEYLYNWFFDYKIKNVEELDLLYKDEFLDYYYKIPTS